MAYYWWEAAFVEGAGKEVIESMCSITEDSKTSIAEVAESDSSQLLADQAAVMGRPSSVDRPASVVRRRL